jgi:hypothetical protein
MWTVADQVTGFYERKFIKPSKATAIAWTSIKSRRRRDWTHKTQGFALGSWIWS